MGEADHSVGDVHQKDDPGDEREHVGKRGNKWKGVVVLITVFFEEVVGNGKKTNNTDRAEDDAKEEDDTGALI